MNANAEHERGAGRPRGPRNLRDREHDDRRQEHRKQQLVGGVVPEVCSSGVS